MNEMIMICDESAILISGLIVGPAGSM